MGYKQTEELIADYLSELLSDNTDLENSDSEVTGPESTNNVGNNKEKSKHSSTNINDDTKSSKKKQDVPPVHKPEATLKPLQSAAQPAINNNSEDAPICSHGSAKVEENSTASGQNNREVISNQTKSDPSIPITSDTPKAKAVAIDKEELPALAYEQHKQRLEKMLMHVSTVEPNPLTKIATTEVSTPFKTEVNTESHPPADDQQVEQTHADYQPLSTLSGEWLENGRPNWAQGKFDILLIEVNGLQLAVPLIALGQIQAMDENLTPLFGQSDWFMGLQQSPVGNIKTVNTAKFIMPERYKDEHDYKFVVSINGLNWGLAVDRIHQPISIDPDSIRWRVNRSSRPWMAGMVRDHMCVLLDIPSMGELLQKQDENHQ
ncbi:MAG: purine-binding chemotaxis protein CheW [Cellvibrionaceae bacterium]|jgi:purine-binding chemotaxis protein CheW